MANREYEDSLIKEGYKYIAGSDEAGRGPLAGPVVIASVILPNNYNNDRIDDSKKLSEKVREELYEEIIDAALAYNIVVIDNIDIDKYNIYECAKKGMIESCLNLKIPCDVFLTDAMKIEDFRCKVIPIIKGDSKSITIASASILAKVTRDRLMKEYDKLYPEYDFIHNKGYGTKKHIQAIEEYGITPIHRKTFDPIKSMLYHQLKLDI